jgi:hypothetical protein
MADVPGAIHIDARTIVDRVRAAADESDNPRGWLPQGTFDDLLEESDRDPIHFHEAIHHLHHNWDRGPARALKERGRGPKAILQRLVARTVGVALDRYFAEEQEFRAAVAQAVDAIAYRVDEISGADERALLELVRRDLIDLARYVEDRTGPGATR